MKTLVMLLTLSLAPCFAQQIAASSEDKVVLQQDTQGNVEASDSATHLGDEKSQFWTSIGTNVVKTLGILAALAFALFVVTALSRWLWNLTMPDVFGLKVITFWQCFRLLVLVFLLGLIVRAATGR